MRCFFCWISDLYWHQGSSPTPESTSSTSPLSRSGMPPDPDNTEPDDHIRDPDLYRLLLRSSGLMLKPLRINVLRSATECRVLDSLWLVSESVREKRRVSNPMTDLGLIFTSFPDSGVICSRDSDVHSALEVGLSGFLRIERGDLTVFFGWRWLADMPITRKRLLQNVHHFNSCFLEL